MTSGEPHTIDREYARAFFRQAKADLKDAKVLSSGRRWAGAVRASQGAVEKALKAALFLELGVAKAAKVDHYVHKRIVNEVRGLAAALGSSILAMIDSLEKHVPTRADNRNPEYPFIEVPGSVSPTAPRDSYTKQDARAARNTATRVLRKVRIQYDSYLA